MRQRFNTRQRNYIILGLCSILLVMAVGYAAFRSQLTINGTSNISSDWKVLITDIQSKTLSGNATDAEAPSHTETTATFKTNLVSPGDSMQYDITVENQGDIDAVLESIDVKTSENEAILFETRGIKRGDKLLPNESDVLTVVVTYNPEVTGQPENLNSEVTVTHNYVQDDGSILPELVDITDNVVTSGDGLYEDSYESGRYVYRGANPNNYIEFNNELWRIISKETDGTYKIVRNEVLPEEMPFDNDNYRDKESNGAGGTYCANSSYGCNAWSSTANMVGSPAEFTNGKYTGTVLLDSGLNEYLNGEYLDSITENCDKIVNYDFSIGGVINNNNDLQGQITSENSYKWNGSVGLISGSDYINANSNIETCGTFSKTNNNYTTCRNTNWMYKSESDWWTLSPVAGDSGVVWTIHGNGLLYNYYSRPSYGVCPAVYLTSSLSLSGSGTQSDPFVIMN